MINEKTNQLAKTALMIALIFVGTFSIRIPNPATGGYFHMGDSMIFLSVLILGKRDGAFAGALPVLVVLRIVATIVVLRYPSGPIFEYRVGKEVVPPIQVGVNANFISLGSYLVAKRRCH